MDLMNDEELLTVIGHEIGHVALEHTYQQMRRSLLTSAAFEGLASTSDKVAALTDSQLGAIGQAMIEAHYSKKQESEADDFSYSFLDAGRKGDLTRLEGYLFPKTYPYDENSTAESLIRAMLDQFAAETTALDWSYAESRGLAPYDVVKLASIVEKESDAAHRAEVASVFYNRLAAGMRLESDATVAYFVGHDPTAEDVNIENEYNTYFIDALPPTPINSPGLDCLQAVCAPAETGYYYFYFESDDNGGMNYTFSETYDEHRAAFE